MIIVIDFMTYKSYFQLFMGVVGGRVNSLLMNLDHVLRQKRSRKDTWACP